MNYLQAELSLPMKAFSINAFYSRDVRHITKEGRAWCQELYFRLDEQREKLQPLIDAFNIAGGQFAVTIIVRYPANVFYNKQKQISARTFDLSNTEKSFLDVLFAKVMGVDDRFITQLISRKMSSTEYGIDLTVALETKSDA